MPTPKVKSNGKPSNQIDTTKANLEHDEQYANNISGITNPEAPIGELRAYHEKKNTNTCCF